MSPVALIHDDAALTKLLGPKCGECGHRRGWHRGPLTGLDACSQYDPADPRPDYAVPQEPQP